jgi:alpha-tubulin suppressor-like RCC1 family protein
MATSMLALMLGVAAPASAAPGEVFGFGVNDLGQLGRPANMTANAPAPVILPGADSPAVQAAAGVKHSLVLTGSGQLYGIGWNGYGQLGNDVKESTSTPTPTNLSGVSGRVVQVAAGRFFSLASTSTGVVYGFGENQFGELGNTTNNGKAEPNATLTPTSFPGATGPVVRIAAGELHSLALTSTGQLYAFGNNYYGQLGNPTTNKTATPNPVPAPVSLPGATGPVVQAAAGANFSLAVTSTGQLYAFGENEYGQLGNPTNVKTQEPTPTPKLVSLPGATGGVVQVAAGYGTSLALTSTGQLFAFGRNSAGELGSAPNMTPNPTPSLMGLPGASGRVVQVSANMSTSLAITSSGQLFMTNGGPAPALVSFPFGTTIDTVSRGSWAGHTLAIVAELGVLTNTLPAGQVGVPYHASAVAAGGTGPYSWGAGLLPPGLSIDTAGQISGTPTAPGATNIVLSASDVFGISASSAAIPLTILPAATKLSGTSSPGFTTAQLKANLLAQLKLSGKAAKIGALLKHKGYSLSFTALTAGSLSVNWYFLPKGAHLSRKKAKPKPLLLASAKVSFKAPGKKKITVKLSSKGISFLRHKQSAKISVKGSFTPTGKKAVSAIKTLTLKR